VSKSFIKKVDDKGSILVVVISFITLITIGMVGFLGVAQNIISQETLEANDDKAFLAAESGLLIGTNWLREANNWVQYKNTGYQGSVYQGTINGYTVTVTVTSEGGSKLRIASHTSGGLLPYSKLLSWTVTEANWNDPGVFINDLSKAGGVGGGGINNEWIDGPMHVNSPLRISSVSGGGSVKFVNGKVSVHNMLEKIGFDAGHWGNYGTSPVSGNDYNFGLWHHSANSYDVIDQHFDNNSQYTEFQHSKDSLYMPRITTQTRTMPVNQDLSQNAILYFNVLNGTTGQATYYYYDGTGAQQSITFNNADEIIRVPNDVCVLGTVKGQTTVITDLGKTIYPVGDLIYHGYQPNFSNMDNYINDDNYGLEALSNMNKDVLALVSGGDIYFGIDKHTLSLENGIATLTAIETKNKDNPNMVVTAQLIATEDDRGIRWADKNASQYNCRLFALGTRAVNTYIESHNAGGGPGSETFTFLYDTRFLDGLKAPGVPSLRANVSSEDLFILNTDWTEENII
jgi:hypothetical protein